MILNIFCILVNEKCQIIIMYIKSGGLLQYQFTSDLRIRNIPESHVINLKSPVMKLFHIMLMTGYVKRCDESISEMEKALARRKSITDHPYLENQLATANLWAYVVHDVDPVQVRAHQTRFYVIYFLIKAFQSSFKSSLSEIKFYLAIWQNIHC